jgi:tight adherence protein B
MKLDVLGWTALILVVLGGSGIVALAFRDKGPVRRFWIQYLGFLDRHRRILFIKPSAREIVGYQVAALVALAAWAALRDGRAVLLLPVAVIAPRVLFPFLRKRRVARIEDQLDGWLTIAANMLQVTSSLTDALTQSLHLIRAPLGQEVDLMLKEVKLGMPLATALRTMADRIGSDLLSNIVTVMVIGRTSGGGLPSLLEEMAATLRERKRLEGVIRRHTASARTQLAVMVAAPFVILYLVFKADPAYFDPLTSSLLGYLLIGLAIVLWLVAIRLARKILTVDI